MEAKHASRLSELDDLISETIFCVNAIAEPGSRAWVDQELDKIYGMLRVMVFDFERLRNENKMLKTLLENQKEVPGGSVKNDG